ncbi:hypothetical protein M9H77_23781 [Catharanthus roseus]|uniref:Uncharacterized protein n=1 Tax=Catharanthus roseus TaxID=4058 RepID=A0ACC0AX25_CATRO|nr:hypothetical protein M9H77_23781 [Catharanthus roseus]
MKSRPRLIVDFHQDDVFQENVDIHEGSVIDVMIKDIELLGHESRSSEELDIIVETYFKIHCLRHNRRHIPTLPLHLLPPTTQPSSFAAPSTDLAAWKLYLGDTRKMRMGPDITHHKDEVCIGGQGRRPDERFL